MDYLERKRVVLFVLNGTFVASLSCKVLMGCEKSGAFGQFPF